MQGVGLMNSSGRQQLRLIRCFRGGGHGVEFKVSGGGGGVKGLGMGIDRDR